MNAATFLSFAGFLAHVSMCRGDIDIDGASRLSDSQSRIWRNPKTAAVISKEYSTNSKKGQPMVGHVRKYLMDPLVAEFRSQIPRIPQQSLNPILSVPESSMVLSSLEVPTIKFPIKDMKLRKSTVPEVIDLSFVIPEITVNFLSRKRPTNRPHGDTIKLRYAFQRINVKLEMKLTPSIGIQGVASATIKKFEPQNVTVRSFEGNSPFQNIIPVKGSEQFKAIMAVATHYIPANFTNGPIVKKFAEAIFF